MKIFEKENGDVLSCQLCGEFIILNSYKYEEKVVEALVERHYKKCKGTKREEQNNNEDIKF